MKNFIIAAAILLSLQGCFFVAGAAAGAAAVAVVYDHRKIEQITEDQKTAYDISQKFKEDTELGKASSHINVTCYSKVVLLTGEAVSPVLRQKAEDIARNMSNVTRVYNEITIKGPSSSLTRASDSWITTKIRSQLIATKGMQSGSFKVVTENGSVYLMGIVTHQQADIAVNIARQVAGVQRVVKIFQYKD